MTGTGQHLTVWRYLDRHDVQRQSGLPIVTTLTGNPELAQRIWSHWLAQRGRSVFSATQTTLGAVVGSYGAALLESRAVDLDACHFVATQLRRDPWSLPRQLAVQGGEERMALLANLHAAGLGRMTVEVIDALLPPIRAPENPSSPRFAELELSPDQVFALVELLPPGELPGILLVAAANSGQGWLHAAATLAAAVTTRAPVLPIALAVAPDVLAPYLASSEESRVRAILREGLVRVEDDPPPGSPAHGLPPRWQAQPILAAANVGSEVREAFDRAARLVEGARNDTKLENRARSAAELFLYQLLELHSETAGLFTLNRRLPFRFGPAPIEIDLVAEPLRIAIEVDGFYHFGDSEAFRRDRRKDLLLQKHGFLISRFLAEDVVCRMEEIMSTVIDLVRFRRRTSPSGELHDDQAD